MQVSWVVSGADTSSYYVVQYMPMTGSDSSNCVLQAWNAAQSTTFTNGRRFVTSSDPKGISTAPCGYNFEFYYTAAGTLPTG